MYHFLCTSAQSPNLLGRDETKQTLLCISRADSADVGKTHLPCGVTVYWGVANLPVGETVLFSHFAGCFTFEAMGQGPVQCEHGRYSAVFLDSHHVLVSGASYRCVICPRMPLVAGERRSKNGACIVCSMDW